MSSRPVLSIDGTPQSSLPPSVDTLVQAFPPNYFRSATEMRGRVRASRSWLSRPDVEYIRHLSVASHIFQPARTFVSWHVRGPTCKTRISNPPNPDRQPSVSRGSVGRRKVASPVRHTLKLIHTATPDTTRLPRLPVDRRRRRRRRDAGQAGSYA